MATFEAIDEDLIILYLIGLKPKENFIQEQLFYKYDSSLFLIQKRKRLSFYQTNLLSRYFSYNPKPNHKMYIFFSKMLNISTRKIRFWFQNKRAEMKRINRLQTKYLSLDEYFS